MKKPNTFKKLKIEEAIYTLSIHSDLSISILKSDCYKTFITYLKTIDGIEREEISRIIYLIKNIYSIEKLLEEENKRLLEKIYELTDSSKLDDLLWEVKSSTPNPIYREISDNYKLLKIIKKIHYLRIAFYFRSKKESSNHFYNCLNLREKCINIKDKIFIFGYIWEYKKFTEYSSNMILINIENNIKNIINILEKNINSVNKIEETFILGHINSYMIEKEKIFDYKVNFVLIAILNLYAILENEEFVNDVRTEIENFEWFNLTSNLLFFLYELDSELKKQLSIKNSFIYSAKKITNKLFSNLFFKNEVKIIKPLSYQKELALSFYADLNNKSEVNKYSISIERDLDLEKKDYFLKIEDYSFYREKDKNDLVDIFERLYSDYNKFGFISEAQKDKIWYNIVKKDLQNIHFEKISKISERITDESLKKTFGHLSIYYEYKGIEDKLCPQNIVLNKEILKSSDVDIKKLKEELLELFSFWSKDSDMRNKSSAYRSLDLNSIISKFTAKSDGNIGLSECLDKEFITQNPFKIYNIEIKDILAIPLSFHNRKLGVIHINSIYSNQFTHRNRIRLVNFIRMVESELFEAKFFKTMSDINKTLGNVLNQTIKEEDFFNEVSIQLGDLLGANGVVILWKNNFIEKDFRVIGNAGNSIKKLFGVGALFNKHRTSLLKKISIDMKIESRKIDKNDGVLSENLVSSNINSYIPIPCIKNNQVIGVIMIFDKKYTAVSKHLDDELNLINNYIQEVILHYFSSLGQIDNLKQMIAHDLDGNLHAILGASNRLKGFAPQIKERKKIFENIITKDIKNNVMASHDFMKIITDNKIRDLSYNNSNNPIVSALTRVNRNKVILPIDINQLVNSVHTKISDFSKKNISFKKEFIEIPIVYLPEGILLDVLNNLFDNISKYGSMNSIFKISSKYDNGLWHLLIENRGLILNDIASRDPELIFSEGERFLKNNTLTKSLPGKGLGLFISRKIVKSWGGTLNLVKYTPLNKDEAMYVFDITFPLWLTKKDYNDVAMA